jgi:hypothetical protein
VGHAHPTHSYLLPFCFATGPFTLILSPEGRRNVRPHPIDLHRPGDVLDGLLPQGLVGQRQFILDVLIDRARNANTPWLGQALQPCGNVDAVAVEPFPLYDHIAQVDANTKLHLTVFRQLGIFRLECVLNLDRAAHGRLDPPCRLPQTGP